MLTVMALFWFGFERKRFQGPPMTEEAIKRRAAEIAAEEKAVGQAAT